VDDDDGDDDLLAVDSKLNGDDIKLDNEESSDATPHANGVCQNNMDTNATDSAQDDTTDENM
jgi:hypothetical protein